MKVALCGVLVLAALAGPAGAQVYTSVAAGPSSAGVSVATFGNIRLQTTVRVPDGGTASLGGYSRVSESRRESGVPILGRVPYAGRTSVKGCGSPSGGTPPRAGR